VGAPRVLRRELSGPTSFAVFFVAGRTRNILKMMLGRRKWRMSRPLSAAAGASLWPTAVPATSDVTLKGRQPFVQSFLADVANALGINQLRLSMQDIVIDTSAAAQNLSHYGSGGIYVDATFSILPASSDTGSDSVSDDNGSPYSPTQLLHYLELLLENPNSQLFQGTFTKSALSVSAVGEDALVDSIPWVRTKTGTAVLYLRLCFCCFLRLAPCTAGPLQVPARSSS
jgi:hypothetical protein